MSKQKVLLGIIREGAGTYADGQFVYLTKHQWDCGWYWGFGYLGNSKTHFHFDSLLKGEAKTASELFSDTKITNKEWWIIRDLFVQAYALQKAAEVYRHGGHQSYQEGLTDMIVDVHMVTRLNHDLEKVLDRLWTYVSEACSKESSDNACQATSVV